MLQTDPARVQFLRERAFLEGRAARRRGDGRTDNPYRRRWRTATGDIQADCWDTGWSTEDRSTRAHYE